MLHRVQQVAAGERIRRCRDLPPRALRHDAAAALARARADVDDVVGAPDGVLVVLHHHQRVALAPSLCSASSRIWLSRACRPMVGSSST
jgi:hypothetical protein